MRYKLPLAVAATAGALGAAGLVAGGVLAQSDELRVPVINVNGKTIGTVTFEETRYGSLIVDARLRGLTPGFHGFHVHAVGRCEAPGFTSSGPHYGGQTGGEHPAHDGDLPVLQVKRNGTATLRTTTDRLTFAELADADGSAVVVHAEADNYGNVPLRYAPQGRDADTRASGDSGARVACGAIAPGS